MTAEQDFFSGNNWMRIAAGLRNGSRANVAIEGVPPGDEAEIIRRLRLRLAGVDVLHCPLAELMADGSGNFSRRLQERIIALFQDGCEGGGQLIRSAEELGLGGLSGFKFALSRLCAQRNVSPVLVLSGYDSLLALDAKQRALVTGGLFFEFVEDVAGMYRFSVVLTSAVPVNWVEFDTPPYASVLYQRMTSYRYSEPDASIREHVLDRMPETDRDRMRTWLQSPLGRLS